MIASFTRIAWASLFLSWAIVAHAKKEKARPIDSDLPLIACDVCLNVIKELFVITEDLRKQAGKKKLEEIKIAEAVDNVCQNDQSEGTWIRHQDITKVGSGNLGLKSMQGVSKCEAECATIEKSCQNLLHSGDEIDVDDLSALLWKGKLSLSSLTDKVCTKVAKRCPSSNTKASQAAVNARQDYPFTEISEKDLEMEQLMAKMQASGLGGGMNMYTRDDMEDMASMMEGYEDSPYADGPYGEAGRAEF